MSYFIPSDRYKIHQTIHTNPIRLLAPLFTILALSLFICLGLSTVNLVSTLIASCGAYLEVFISLDLAKGYLQYLLSERLRKYSNVGPGHAPKMSFAALRLFLGLV